MPFNWKTPFGYFVAWLTEASGAVGVFTTCTLVFMFMFDSCQLFVFIAEDITNELADFNDAVKKPNANHEELMDRLSNSLQAYSDAKELR